MEVNEASELLHKIFNDRRRIQFPYNADIIPCNGIYILFEKEEKFNKLYRIVRVGTHKTNCGFTKRLKQHFFAHNQRASVFRKHIGRCFLSIENDPYIDIWNLNLKGNRDQIDLMYEQTYEQKITEYIHENFSFIIIPNLNNAVQRLKIESALIATIAKDEITSPSANWLGKHHPNTKISTDGKLWNIQHLKGETITEEQIRLIQEKLN